MSVESLSISPNHTPPISPTPEQRTRRARTSSFGGGVYVVPTEIIQGYFEKLGSPPPPPLSGRITPENKD